MLQTVDHHYMSQNGACITDRQCRNAANRKASVSIPAAVGAGLEYASEVLDTGVPDAMDYNSQILQACDTNDKITLGNVAKNIWSAKTSPPLV